MYYTLYHIPIYQPMYHFPDIHHFQFPSMRAYPPVNPTILSQSVKEFQILMQQSELLINKLSDTAYSTKLMEEAQQGNQSEVDRLIKSIDGLYVSIQIHYTPSGAIFDLQSPAVGQGADCCTLRMTLKWGK